MGAFFSLRGAAEWEDAVSQMAIPSIWSNVNYSPLTRAQKVLLDRSGKAQYSFPSGLRQGGELVKMADTSDASLLAAVDDHAGHFYCALMLSCPHPHLLHRLRKQVEEVSLKQPGSLTESRSTEKPKRGAGLTPLMADTVLRDEGEGMQEELYEYMLIYAVKEGVLLYFAHEQEECEAIVQLIAASYCRDGGARKRTIFEQGGDEGAVPPRIKLVNLPVGRCCPPVSRVLSDAMVADLKREFTIRCEPDEWGNYTNCVALTMRLLKATQLAVRGYDVSRACENCPELGPKAGLAAAEAWEQLLRVVP